jgi:Icc-related predicted phosphoesterase
LAIAVEKIKLKLHIFGHIHGGHGDTTSNGTRFMNASAVNEGYWPAYEPHIVEIDISSGK